MWVSYAIFIKWAQHVGGKVETMGWIYDLLLFYNDKLSIVPKFKLLRNVELII